MQELNALYTNKAKELIEKGRAHERFELVRVAAEGYLAEPLAELIPEGFTGQLREEQIKEDSTQSRAQLVKELLKESRANQKVLEVLSRNSGNFDKVTALLKSIIDATE